MHQDDAKHFEAFVNYVLFRSMCAENVDPSELTYTGADPGIDGVMIFIDDVYVSSVEEAEESFKKKKKDSDAVVIFT